MVKMVHGLQTFKIDFDDLDAGLVDVARREGLGVAGQRG
jgi:hypothetical protein